MSIVQSVLFNKDDFTLEKALKFLVDNDYKYNKIDFTKNMMRFRQEDPKNLLKKGYNEYRIKKLKNGVELVLAFKKENNYTYIAS